QRLPPRRFDGPGVCPVGEEDSQVDVRPQYDAHAFAGSYVFITAMTFMHTPLVAGEGHDSPEGAQRLEYFLGRGSKDDRVHSSRATRDKFELRHPHFSGDVANACIRLTGHSCVVTCA